MCKRSDTERAELPASTNLIASNFSSNVLLRIWTVSVVSNFVGSLHACPYDPGESMESNCSMIEKIPHKGVSFSDFICTFAMSCYDLRLF